jgi:hypothetical protein
MLATKYVWLAQLVGGKAQWAKPPLKEDTV